MKCLISSTRSPATFLIGGKFISSVSWKHECLTVDDYELFICLKGHLPLFVNDKNYLLHPNDFLLVPRHSRIVGSDKTESVSFLWLHFLPSTNSELKEISSSIIESLFKKNKPISFYLPLFFKLSDIDRILVLAHQLLNNYWQDRYQFEERNYLLTNLLLTLSSEFYQSLESQCENTDAVRIRHIKDWIRANMSDHLKVEHVSENFGLSNQYLSRLFKKHEGITIIQYINFQRIQVAQVLLIETSLSVKEISSYAYFRNEKQFFSQFKKITGTTPLKFRQEHGTIHTNNPYVDPDLPIPKKATLILRKLHEK